MATKINYTKIREKAINTAKSLSNKELLSEFIAYCMESSEIWSKELDIHYEVYLDELTSRLGNWLKE